jgi:geranylgeranyl pyrophosphate synthase
LIGDNSLIDASFAALVEDRLGLVEERMRAQADGHHAAVGAALHHLLGSGGKRIRVIITLLTGKMLGADQDKLVTLAASIESLHTATLVHDDLIDGAMIRRGIPTLNAQWSPAATVLTGDFIFSKAAKLAADTGSIAVMRIFAETLSTIVNGEITQLFSSRWIANREDYYRRIYAKTASLFETSTTTAALLSNASQQVTAMLKYFGYEVGMAFQMIDDILDFTSEQTTMGKPVASDLRQGIITLPVLYYLESHPDDADMRTILDSNFCDEDCLGRLLTSIRDSGAIKRSHEEARQSIQRGLDILRDLPETEERKALEDLAAYIVDREL